MFNYHTYEKIMKKKRDDEVEKIRKEKESLVRKGNK